MAVAEPSPLLACGRDAATTWDRAEAGLPPDEHERGCPHCTAARADASGLEAMIGRLARERPEPPPNVLDPVMDAVMDAVVAQLRPHDLLVLDSPLGEARLSRVAAAAVLREVVDRMGGMRARSCRITQTGFTVDVAMTVAARFGVDLASVAARVRQMVVAAGDQALGLAVRTVDIEVVDVWEET
jgi:hypothetical protein